MFQPSGAFISYSTNCCTRSKNAASKLPHSGKTEEAKEDEDRVKGKRERKRERKGGKEKKEEDKGRKNINKNEVVQPKCRTFSILSLP